MTELILFRPANRQRRRDASGEAQIFLFFTGVRYQRIAEEPRDGGPRAIARPDKSGGGTADRARRPR